MNDRIELGRAQQRARRLYPRGPAFQDTYVRGVRSALAGRPIDDCPYPIDRRNTWRARYRSAWLRGWQSVEQPLAGC